MKKNHLLIPVIAIAMTACGNSQQKGSEFATDSVTFEQTEKSHEVKIYADYPTAGNTILTGAIAEYVSEAMGGTYEGNLGNGDSLVAHYGNDIAKRLKEEYEDVESSSNAPYAYSMEIRKENETGKTVTYTALGYSYTGGAHGMSTKRGTTFRKTDGRRFGTDMMRNTDTEEFRKMIKEGLRTYFKANGEEPADDEQLKQMLLTENSVDFLPLPQAAPYLTEDGVTFIYQQYEIAPYAAGMPTFTIPYDKIKPYLTVTGQGMIE